MPSHRARAGLAALVIWHCLAAIPAVAQTVGVATSVAPGAFVEADGVRRPLTARAPVSNGDAVLTDASGTVQLTFSDRTRVVVGPNTRFEIDDVVLNSNQSASRFVVSLIGGVFRFLTGNSPKPAYEVRTPTATMGIRGTVFDVAVDSRRTTRLVTFDGTVRFCSRWRRCAAVASGCAMVQTQSFGRIRPPEDKTERDAALNTLFPLVTDQRRLGGAFRARTESCGDINPLVFLTTPPAPSPLAAPAPGRDGGGDRRGGGGGSGGDRGKDDP